VDLCRDGTRYGHLAATDPADDFGRAHLHPRISQGLEAGAMEHPRPARGKLHVRIHQRPGVPHAAIPHDFLLAIHLG